MIPGRKLSDTPFYSTYLYPDILDVLLLEDYELGGKALEDLSEGLQYQAWKLSYVDPDVIVTPLDDGSPSTLFSIAGITELSLAFDQNMHPFVAYVVSDNAWYWWYNPLLTATEHVQMAANVTAPRCCLDDKRASRSASSDIILAYVKDSTDLYFREQSDRFVAEYLLKASIPNPYLNRVGMNEKRRLQFVFGITA